MKRKWGESAVSDPWGTPSPSPSRTQPICPRTHSPDRTTTRLSNGTATARHGAMQQTNGHVVGGSTARATTRTPSSRMGPEHGPRQGPEQGPLPAPPLLPQQLEKMVKADPKRLLGASPALAGCGPNNVHIPVEAIGRRAEQSYRAVLSIRPPGGEPILAHGVARTKKEAQKLAGIDACRKLYERGLLLPPDSPSWGTKAGRPSSASAADTGPWGSNPKQILAKSQAYWARCHGDASHLPISLKTAFGPEHARRFVSQIVIPLELVGTRGPGGVPPLPATVEGVGPSKQASERACVVNVCEVLHAAGLLHKPDTSRTSPSAAAAIVTAHHSDAPPSVSLTDSEVGALEIALDRLQAETPAYAAATAAPGEGGSSHTDTGVETPYAPAVVVKEIHDPGVGFQGPHGQQDAFQGSDSRGVVPQGPHVWPDSQGRPLPPSLWQPPPSHPQVMGPPPTIPSAMAPAPPLALGMAPSRPLPSLSTPWHPGAFHAEPPTMAPDGLAPFGPLPYATTPPNAPYTQPPAAPYTTLPTLHGVPYPTPPADSGLYQFVPPSVPTPTPAALVATNERLRTRAIARKHDPVLADRLRRRDSLPAAGTRQAVLDAVRAHRVVMVTGETGCGKTTQVPQFLVEEAEAGGWGGEVNVVCTQPRRIAAVSVAERVAWERGEALGHSVGYQIRLESTLPSEPGGTILFCTTGILLRRLHSPGGISGVTHVIVDEVHERDCDTDFLLIVLKELVVAEPKLRVVVMSATVDTVMFQRYLGNCPIVHIPGATYPVQVHYLEDLPRLMGPSCPGPVRHGVSRHQHASRKPSETGSARRRGDSPRTPSKAEKEEAGVEDAGDEEEGEVDVDLTAALIVWVAENHPENHGAILCFLPGWDQIMWVRSRLQLLEGRSRSRLLIRPLHSQLPSVEQRAVFENAPAGVRKVILATNIAETSITIDDVGFVVDTGLAKETSYSPRQDMRTMKVQWTSKASARQRQGRAGRVRSGVCFRLYSHSAHGLMPDRSIPEMRRTPLEELCLQVKAILRSSEFGRRIGSNSSNGDVGDSRARGLLGSHPSKERIASFLAKALEPPPLDAVRSAIVSLQQMGALDLAEDLTPLGTVLSRLAVHPRLGKMLVFGALLASSSSGQSCLHPLLTVAAAACSRDPFVSPVALRTEANQSRAAFASGAAANSDHLALASAFDRWDAVVSGGSLAAGQSFAEQRFLSQSTLKLMTGLRKQFIRNLTSEGLLSPRMESHLVTPLTAAPAPATTTGPASRTDGASATTAGQQTNEGAAYTATEATPAVAAGPFHVARAVLCAGLYPNVARSDLFRENKGGNKTRCRLGLRPLRERGLKGSRVFVHPGSVINEKKLSASQFHLLVFNEKVLTNQVFVRGCSLVPPIAVVLLSGPVSTSTGPVSTATNPSVDDRLQLTVGSHGGPVITFSVDKRTGLLLVRVRQVLDLLMSRWIGRQRQTPAERALLQCLTDLLEAAGRGFVDAGDSSKGQEPAPVGGDGRRDHGSGW